MNTSQKLIFYTIHMYIYMKQKHFLPVNVQIENMLIKGFLMNFFE